MGSIPPNPGPLLCVVGARPNYMKMAPLVRAFGEQPALPRAVLIHTGQHYDIAMNERLFADLALPPPEINLEVGSGTHAVQTAEIMRRFEPVVDQYQPSCVIVVGDVNSTLACSLVAVKKFVPVVHVEAGLRSFDEAMPEEINRVITDRIASVLYTTESAAAENLRREGVAAGRIHFAGNVMIDSLRACRRRAVPPADTLRRAGVDRSKLDPDAPFGLVTLHRPSNVDTARALAEAVETLRQVSSRVPLVWPIHPRTRANIARFDLDRVLSASAIVLLEPLGYLEALGMMAGSSLVLTDSGGIQEETTALGVCCLTLRENTERPVTVTEGTNTLVGRDRDLILRLVEEILRGDGKRGRVPPLWDGHAAQRIAAHLANWLQREPATVEA